jgi:hypothetical protein
MKDKMSYKTYFTQVSKANSLALIRSKYGNFVSSLGKGGG